MKVLGIVAEYNPFHNGHLYQLEKSIQDLKPDYTIVIMSGNFTQRGEPALASKWLRSEAAVRCGVDLVIELPFVYACNNAEYFAKGAIGILNALGCVSHLSFGSESGNLEDLQKVAHLLADETDAFKESLKMHLSEGLSYPKAREKAISDCLSEECAALTAAPNNILAIEYLKQLTLLNSNIQPYTVQRMTAGYHDTELKGSIASATAIRNNFFSSSIAEFMPSEAFEAFKNINISANSKAILYHILTSKILSTTTEDLERIFSISEGLENRLKENIRSTSSLEDLKVKLISKRYTQTRINRLLIHTLFNLTSEDFASIDIKERKYARILAFNENGAKLIKHIKNNELSSIPIITNINKEADLLKESQLLLRYDTLSSDLYNLIAGEDLYKGSDYLCRPYINR